MWGVWYANKQKDPVKATDVCELKVPASDQTRVICDVGYSFSFARVLSFLFLGAHSSYFSDLLLPPYLTGCN